MMQLLVSVRDAAEARAALTGGADIIDVKEPLNGALGFAGLEKIQGVLSEIQNAAPVSAALGECCEWLPDGSVPRLFDHSTIGSSFSGALSFVKLGLAGLKSNSASNWNSAWQNTRDQFNAQFSMTEQQPEWVAVVYADFQQAGAPSAADILEAGIQSRCTVLLIDTFQKDGSGVFDHLNIANLQNLRQQAHQAGLRFALAGQLTLAQLPSIREVAPDIVAVRGAACEGSSREATICVERVQQLKSALKVDSGIVA